MGNFDQLLNLNEYEYFKGEKEFLWVELHGECLDDALRILEEAMIEANRLKINVLKINHGKGKGVLRQGVVNKLNHYQKRGIIQKFKFASKYSGGKGVTIVHIL